MAWSYVVTWGLFALIAYRFTVEGFGKFFTFLLVSFLLHIVLGILGMFGLVLLTLLDVLSLGMSINLLAKTKNRAFIFFSTAFVFICIGHATAYALLFQIINLFEVAIADMTIIIASVLLLSLGFSMLAKRDIRLNRVAILGVFLAVASMFMPWLIGPKAEFYLAPFGSNYEPVFEFGEFHSRWILTVELIEISIVFGLVGSIWQNPLGWGLLSVGGICSFIAPLWFLDLINRLAQATGSSVWSSNVSFGFTFALVAGVVLWIAAARGILGKKEGEKVSFPVKGEVEQEDVAESKFDERSLPDIAEEIQAMDLQMLEAKLKEIEDQKKDLNTLFAVGRITSKEYSNKVSLLNERKALIETQLERKKSEGER